MIRTDEDYQELIRGIRDSRVPPITEAHHEQAVRVALERGEDLGAQAQFERDVRASCICCDHGDPLDYSTFYHKRWNQYDFHCNATYIRRANPERSRRMDAPEDK